MRKHAWLGLLWLLTAPVALAQAPSLRGLDAYVGQVMRDWHVPGLAIAVVQDGKVVVARGYGVRELGKPGKVDAETLFDIGSNTKAFTAAALGTLVASGKLDWDARVADTLPSFRLGDPWATENVSLRDLLTHRTGYCDPTIAWYTSDATDILERVRHQEPKYGFRTTFCYNNVQYLAASRFIPALTGHDWNDYVATHLLQPLGMTRTVSTAAGVVAAGNAASPHGMVDGKPEVIPRYWPHNMDIFASVGGIWSSADDMGRWLRMLLADGKFDGQTVLDPSVVRAMETPEIMIQAGTEVGDEIRTWLPGARFYTYGLGLFVQDFHGHTLVWHAGDIDGMASALVLVPDARLGVVVLSNMNAAGARFAIIARVLQSTLGLPEHDLDPTLLADARKAEADDTAMQRKLAATRVSGARPPLPLADYVGRYRDPLDGTAEVTRENGRLVLHLGNPSFTGDLQPWHGNTFRVAWRERFYGDDFATFDVDALNRPTRISFAGLPLHFERERAPNTPAGNP